MNIKIKYKAITSFLLILVMHTTLFATTVYVDQTSGDDMNDGLTPGTAVATISQGNALIGVGDTLNIGPGTYSASTGESFPLSFPNGVNLEGAGPDQTLLDGELGSNLLNISGSTATVNISGLAIINGLASVGAGINVNGVSQLNLSDCLFENNDADIGGGVIIFNTPEISVFNCQFDGNDGNIGGALQIQINSDIDVMMNVIQSTFINNTGNVGTAINFQENGSGVHSLHIDQSQFFNNSSTGFTFSGGGGTSLSQITNSIFANHSDVALSTSASDIDIVNVTFVNNLKALETDSQATVVNSIFWGNDTEISGGGASISFSIIQDLDIDNHIDDGNNMDVDPLLDNGYRLTGDSPAIDMGSDQAVDSLDVSQDIDLEPRKANYSGLNRPEGVVDIGADEVPDLIFANGFEAILL